VYAGDTEDGIDTILFKQLDSRFAYIELCFGIHGHPFIEGRGSLLTDLQDR
jgi:hypothetical protein